MFLKVVCVTEAVAFMRHLRNAQPVYGGLSGKGVVLYSPTGSLYSHNTRPHLLMRYYSSSKRKTQGSSSWRLIVTGVLEQVCSCLLVSPQALIEVQ